MTKITRKTAKTTNLGVYLLFSVILLFSPFSLYLCNLREVSNVERVISVTRGSNVEGYLSALEMSHVRESSSIERSPSGRRIQFARFSLTERKCFTL